MRFLERFARGELRLTRIEAFSDGVFAIIVRVGAESNEPRSPR